jgi:hypothetical protein
VTLSEHRIVLTAAVLTIISLNSALATDWWTIDVNKDCTRAAALLPDLASPGQVETMLRKTGKFKETKTNREDDGSGIVSVTVARTDGMVYLFFISEASCKRTARWLP